MAKFDLLKLYISAENVFYTKFQNRESVAWPMPLYKEGRRISVIYKLLNPDYYDDDIHCMLDEILLPEKDLTGFNPIKQIEAMNQEQKLLYRWITNSHPGIDYEGVNLLKLLQEVECLKRERWPWALKEIQRIVFDCELEESDYKFYGLIKPLWS